MADDIKLQSIACAEKDHEICEMPNCHCECHLPQSQQSIRWRLEQLSGSNLPDSDRLQKLIDLMLDLTRKI